MQQLLLRTGRDEIVVIIQPDFTDRNDPGMLRGFEQLMNIASGTCPASCGWMPARDPDVETFGDGSGLLRRSFKSVGE
jgi:hypothetical protein